MTFTPNPEAMDAAYREAAAGLRDGGVPVGAALEVAGTVLGSGRNERVQAGDPVAHGEISCLRNVGRRASYRDATLYTTLAPCAMCTGAILLFNIPRVVVGEAQTFPGELDRLREQGVAVVVLNDDRCIQLMKDFQARFPEVWAEDIGQLPPL